MTIDENVAEAQMGDMIEFRYPGMGISLWGVYCGDGYVVHFGVTGEDVLHQLCRSFLQPLTSTSGVLRRTRVRRQLVTEIKVHPGTRIRVNNNKHPLCLGPEDLLMHRCEALLDQEFTYDLLNLNSEHFATFVRYGHAVCNQKKNKEDLVATQTFEAKMPDAIETSL